MSLTTIEEARQLYHQHSAIAERIGGKQAARGPRHYDDLMQAARLGLWQACLRWDPAKVPGDRGFEHYAAQRVQWAVLDGWRRVDHMHTHRRRAVKAGEEHNVTLRTTEGMLDLRDPGPDPADVAATRADAATALWHLACLPSPTREVFARYALVGDTLKSIADDYGKSEAWAYLQRRKAIGMLRQRLALPVSL